MMSFQQTSEVFTALEDSFEVTQSPDGVVCVKKVADFFVTLDLTSILEEGFEIKASWSLLVPFVSVRNTYKKMEKHLDGFFVAQREIGEKDVRFSKDPWRGVFMVQGDRNLVFVSVQSPKDIPGTTALFAAHLTEIDDDSNHFNSPPPKPKQKAERPQKREVALAL